MRLLIVGSLEGQMIEAGKMAAAKGAKVHHAISVEQALDALRAGKGADMAMVDIRQDIAGFVEALKAERIVLPVVACGIGSDPQTAARAIRFGAREYVPLPPDAQLIAAVIEAVAGEDNTMIARDPVMLQTQKLAEQIAPSEATVLIAGESGTGKEVMARFIHQKSRRSNGPFVAVNCAAIPENLLESELFGHEKGAFTGAVARRLGKFEEANGGTLLLDEISEMDIRLQAKLLRAIQERVIDRVGGNAPVKINVRILATTNRDMEQHIKDGKFREDLYFRLNVVQIAIPPLRDRPADIAHLSQHFVKKFSALNGLPEARLTPEALARLTTHHWRGNVRELENAIHRAVLLAPSGEIGPEAVLLTGPQVAQREPSILANAPLPALPVTSPAAPPQPAQPAAAANMVGRTVADVERSLILDTLDHCLGNRTHAANILGISIRTLRNKLKQYTDEGHLERQTA